MTTGRVVPERPPSLLRRRNFFIYWAGGLASNVGTWLQNVTASVVVLNLTHSPLLVGVLNFATFAPVFVFSVFGGALSDRFDRKLIVVLTQSFSLIVASVLTAMSIAGDLSFEVLIGAAFLLGSSYSIAKPALSAMLPSLVSREELGHATAINTLQFNIGQVGGSSLSALLLAIASPSWAFGVNAVSFLAPLGAMFVLKLRADDRAGPRKLRGSGLEGLRYVLSSRAMTALLAAVVLSNASVEGLRTLSPSIATKMLDLHSSAAGLLVTAYSIGATAGLLTFGWLARRVPPSRLLYAAFLLQAIGVAGIACSFWLVSAAVFAVPIGLGFAFNIPVLSAGLQQLSPPEFQGRVMSTFNMCHLGLRPVFSLTAGALATLLNTRLALVIFLIFPLLALKLVGPAGRGVEQARAEATKASPA